MIVGDPTHDILLRQRCLQRDDNINVNKVMFTTLSDTGSVTKQIVVCLTTGHFPVCPLVSVMNITVTYYQGRVYSTDSSLC